MSGDVTQSHATASDVTAVTSLDDLNNVDLVNGLVDNQLLAYNSGTSQWENISINDVNYNNEWFLGDFTGAGGFRTRGVFVESEDDRWASIELREWDQASKPFGLHNPGVQTVVFGGTPASPAAVGNGTIIGAAFHIASVDNTGVIPITANAGYFAQTTEAQTPTTRGTKLVYRTTPNGFTGQYQSIWLQGNTLTLNPSDPTSLGEAVIDSPSGGLRVQSTKRGEIHKTGGNSGNDWDTIRARIDRSAPVSNEYNAIGYWALDGNNNQVELGSAQMRTLDVTVDGNNAYTDFTNDYEIWTTTMSTSAITWHKNQTINHESVSDHVPHVFVNMDTTARNALTAQAGMTIFNTTTSKLETYDGTTWQAHW